MRRAYRDLLAATLIVNLKNGRAFRGILWSENGDLLVLRNAVLFAAGEEPTDVDGDVIVERHDIDFIQRLP